MYSVVLVDDDIVVLSFLKKMVNWEKYGFQVQYAFQDSEKALEYLQQEPIHLLITDIGMPKLNGIELIRHVKNSENLMQTVILSCHDEFHYAQQALKLQTFDYLLKETMEQHVIEELLNRVKIQLDKVHQSQSSLKELEVLRQEAAQFFSGETEKKPGKLYALLWTILVESPWNYALYFQKLLPQGSRVYPYEKGFLLQTEAGIPPNNLVKYLQQEKEFPISFLYSDDVTQLLENYQQCFYLASGCIQKVEDHLFQEDKLFKRYSEIIEEAERLLLQENKEAVMDWVQKQIHFITENKQEPDAVRSWGVKIVIDLQMKLYSLYEYERSDYQTFADDRLKKAETIDEFEEALLKAFYKLWTHVQNCLGNSLKGEIAKAQKYVHMHIDQKISLQEVAEQLHLNASYFSRLYKQQTGETFISYVIKAKMIRAKDLLDHTNKTVDEIADLLGYESNSYFFKIFKKYYGLPPKEYRSRLLSK